MFVSVSFFSRCSYNEPNKVFLRVEAPRFFRKLNDLHFKNSFFVVLKFIIENAKNSLVSLHVFSTASHFPTRAKGKSFNTNTDFRTLETLGRRYIERGKWIAIKNNEGCHRAVFGAVGNGPNSLEIPRRPDIRDKIFGWEKIPVSGESLCMHAISVHWIISRAQRRKKNTTIIAILYYVGQICFSIVHIIIITTTIWRHLSNPGFIIAIYTATVRQCRPVLNYSRRI